MQKASQKSIDYPLILRSNSIYGTQSKTLMYFENIMPNKMQIKALEGIEKIRLQEAMREEMTRDIDLLAVINLVLVDQEKNIKNVVVISKPLKMEERYDANSINR